METLGDNSLLPLCPKFNCEVCNYTTSKKSSYDYHILSQKHKKRQNGDVGDINSAKFMPLKNLRCNSCNKEYTSRNGLWKHKHKGNCINQKNIIEDKPHENKNITDLTNTIIELLKQNAELIKENSEYKNMMMKVIENGTHNTTNNTNNTHTNSHNKAFNLNFFLNETCKNAMNITDFVDSIKLQLSDLIDMGDIGYVEGISKIIVKNLNALDETERPVHCTDKKRETFYIKDANQWEKEDDNKTKLRKAIKTVANKNIRLLPQFREKYPDYGNSESSISDKYSKMVIEAMGGQGDNDAEKEEKIIRNISRATTISNKATSNT